jgi:hypothetical protein
MSASRSSPLMTPTASIRAGKPFTTDYVWERIHEASPTFAERP